MNCRFATPAGASIPALAAATLLYFLHGGWLGVAAADEAVDWTGVWDSRWRDGGALLFLEQDGQQVSGVYPTLDGTIEGRVEDGRLTGEWRDPGGAGSFTFTLSPDGLSFMGRFGTGEWWTAERLSKELAAAEASQVDAGSPAVQSSISVESNQRSNLNCRERSRPVSPA